MLESEPKHGASFPRRSPARQGVWRFLPGLIRVVFKICYTLRVPTDESSNAPGSPLE